MSDFICKLLERDSQGIYIFTSPQLYGDNLLSVPSFSKEQVKEMGETKNQKVSLVNKKLM